MPTLGNPVILMAQEDVWIEIKNTAGKVYYSFILPKGEAFVPPPGSGLLLTTGNGGNTVLTLGGKMMGPLGSRGSVIRNIPLQPEMLRQYFQK